MHPRTTPKIPLLRLAYHVYKVRNAPPKIAIMRGGKLPESEFLKALEEVNELLKITKN